MGIGTARKHSGAFKVSRWSAPCNKAQQQNKPEDPNPEGKRHRKIDKY